MKDTEQTDFDFITLVSKACLETGCTLTQVDGREISITCPNGAEQELKCAEKVRELIDERE